MGTSSNSWFSLVAKNQDSSSGAMFVRLKHARVEENYLLLCLFLCQFWHLSLVNLSGLIPNPQQLSGVAKDIECLCVLAAGLSPLKEV